MSTDTTAPPPSAPSSPDRILAIDAVRGFDMFWIAGPFAGHWLVMSFCAMVFGEVPESVKYYMGHHWGVFTPWDLIMPLFLFIVGAAMPFSLGRRIDLGDSRGAVYSKALKRAAILWVFGVIVQGNLLKFELAKLYLYSNTLQAIAAGYLIATVTMFELRSIRAQAVVCAALLLVFWAAMALIPHPNGPAGDYSPQGNLAMWIDQAVLGSFRAPNDYTWILSSLGFGATTLLGVFAGRLLQSPSLSPKRKFLLLIGGGLGLLLLGWLWSFAIPCIKHLWTPSMVLWSGGWCLLVLAAFYGVIDIIGWRRWCFPLVVIGANAILAYLLQPLFDVRHLGEHLFGGFSRLFGGGGKFVLAVLTCTSLWFGLWWLYRNKIFLRV